MSPSVRTSRKWRSTAVRTDWTFTPALRTGGWICFEFGFRQHMQVGMLLSDAGYCNLRFVKDSGGIIRAVCAQKIKETNV